jgi:ABC-type uncharacterized transport system auxiliary subunit
MTLTRIAILLGLGATLAGCVSLTAKPSPPVQEYRLDYAPPPAGGEALPVTLRVAALRVASAYAGSGIVYREDAHRLGAYTYHRWISEPGGMVGELLARDLVSSGRYPAVEYGPSLLPAEYEVTGEVEEMEERSENGCQAHLQIRVLLRRVRPRSREGVVFQRRYEAARPCTAGDARSIVEALSASLADISGHLQADLAAAISGDLTVSETPSSSSAR